MLNEHFPATVPRRYVRYTLPLDTDEIKRLRKKLGLSQEEAAVGAGLVGRSAKPGTGKSNWAKLENEKTAPNITLAKLEAIARVLGVRAKDLLR